MAYFFFNQYNIICDTNIFSHGINANINAHISILIIDLDSS
jgi:hypothetical protein